MKRLRSGQIGIDQGSHVLFSDFADGGRMWTGSGPREIRHLVTFSQPFLDAPSVVVSISMWDLDRETNARADIGAAEITEAGFQLVFRTWGDTRVARIRADWMAVGALQDEDHWAID